MAWTKLGQFKGWTAFWETRDHRMYAKSEALFKDVKHFRGRPADRVTAWAIFTDWARDH